MTTLVVLGNRLGIQRNPWAGTPYGKKAEKIFNKTGRRAKLAQHPAVVRRWELFREVRPRATAECQGKTGMDKAVCIVSAMSRMLKGG